MGVYVTQCANCGKQFERENKRRIENQKKLAERLGFNRSDDEFCCFACSAEHRCKRTNVRCGWCNELISKEAKEIKKSKSGFAFCDCSCAACYNNTKRRGKRRSKCEKKLFDLLVERYPQLEIFPNDKTLLDGMEADIAIPSLKMVIEWNGVVHYKPIYGVEKLDKIREIDKRKQEVAERKGLSFIVVPDLVSTEKYVREAFVNICRIVDELIGM